MGKIIVGALLVASGVIAEITPDEIIEFKKTEQRSLTLHVFNPPNHKASDKTPAIVFFFGYARGSYGG